MKTKVITSKASQGRRMLWLSLLSAGVIAVFMSGCAEGPYVTTYDSGSYYPTSYYTPSYYDYYIGYPYGYGPTYRYYNVYGGPYYGGY